MITILTGDKNAGKTSYLEAWYDREKRGVGFCCRKVWHGETCEGYDLVLFPDGGSRPFIRLKEEPFFAAEAWGEGSEKSSFRPAQRSFPANRFAVGEEKPESGSSSRFHFDPAGFLLAEQWIRNHPWSRTAPVWIDEIGRLELEGKGFDALFRRVLAERREIRVVFRKQVLKDLIARYGLRGYRLIVL